MAASRIIEDCGKFGVYCYARPTGHTKSGARHRGETPMIQEWAFVLRSADGASWSVGLAVPGFDSKDAAMSFARAAIADASSLFYRGKVGRNSIHD